MQIYADFNCLEASPTKPEAVIFDMTGYGTLASLNLHQVRLQVGQHLILCDPDGLQAVGEIDFDPGRQSLHRSGWVAKFNRHDISEVSPQEHDYTHHLCFKCRKDLQPYLEKVGRQFNENCPNCGTPIMFPLLPPEN